MSYNCVWRLECTSPAQKNPPPSVMSAISLRPLILKLVSNRFVLSRLDVFYYARDLNLSLSGCFPLFRPSLSSPTPYWTDLVTRFDWIPSRVPESPS